MKQSGPEAFQDNGDRPVGPDARAASSAPDASLPSLESIVEKLPEETRKALEEELRGRFVHVQRIDPSVIKKKRRGRGTF